LTVNGLTITPYSSEQMPIHWCLCRYSDSNLTFNFTEEDKEELMALNPEAFEVYSQELGQEITTHEQLASILLPAPVKKTKAKTSTLKEE